MFVVKNDDGKNDHKRYKSIYFNYFLISYYRVKLFLAMQVRVMAACMESQSNIRSAQSRPRDGRGVSDVYVLGCFMVSKSCNVITFLLGMYIDLCCFSCCLSETIFNSIISPICTFTLGCRMNRMSCFSYGTHHLKRLIAVDLIVQL